MELMWGEGRKENQDGDEHGKRLGTQRLLASRVTEEEQRKKALDLEREDGELVEQEEAAAIATFSFPAVLRKSPVEPPAKPSNAPFNPEPSPKEEDETALPPFVADGQTFITDDKLPKLHPPPGPVIPSPRHVQSVSSTDLNTCGNIHPSTLR